MKELSEIILPEALVYTDEHIWVRRDGDAWCAGVSDFAQDQLGEVVYVDLPSEGDAFGAGDEFGTVESIKSVNPLFMPVAGTILAINEDLDSTPTLVNADCYTKAWMIRFEAESDDAVAALLSAEAYRALLSA